MRKYFDLFNVFENVDYKTEVLSGLIIAIALIPEAVAFALIAGLSPLTGLYAAFVMCFVTSVFGGRPGMISGATGAVAVVIVTLVKTHGVEYVCNASVLCWSVKFYLFEKMVPSPLLAGEGQDEGDNSFLMTSNTPSMLFKTSLSQNRNTLYPSFFNQSSLILSFSS